MQNKIFVLIWIVLAVISFVSSFWAPLFFKILGIVFGSVNILVILCWFITIFVMKNKPEVLEEDKDGL
jgi:pilus assembly protein TadC